VEKIKPLDASIPSFSEAMSPVLFGEAMAKNPRLVELAYKLTEDCKGL
jgi:hypothetical protein